MKVNLDLRYNRTMSYPTIQTEVVTSTTIAPVASYTHAGGLTVSYEEDDADGFAPGTPWLVVRRHGAAVLRACHSRALSDVFFGVAYRLGIC